VIASGGLQGQEQMLTARCPAVGSSGGPFVAEWLHDPEVLFFSMSPLSGVDPPGAAPVRRLNQRLRPAAPCHLGDHHYLEEDEAVQPALLMWSGENVIEAAPKRSKAAQPGQCWSLVFAAGSAPSAAQPAAAPPLAVRAVSRFRDLLHPGA